MTKQQRDDSGVIVALDPGNTLTGYVVAEHDGREIRRILEKDKINNELVYGVLLKYKGYALAVEMIASYGMPVGAEVFETCVWIGRYLEYARALRLASDIQLIYRKEEKLYLCGYLTAKDRDITRALVERYARGAPNYGKGTKGMPGFFYGFRADMWAAMAVATTYIDKYIRGIKIYAD